MLTWNSQRYVGAAIAVAIAGFGALAHAQITPAQQIIGPPVATLGVPARFVFPLNDAIAVVNTGGEVWVHDLTGNTLADALHITGPAVATLGVPAR